MGREASFMHREKFVLKPRQKMCCAPLAIAFLLFLLHVIEVCVFSNQQRVGKEQDGAVICMALLSRGCRGELCAGRAVTARCSLHLGETLFCLDGKKKIGQERENQKCWDFSAC